MTRPHNQYDKELNKIVLAKWATPIDVYRNMHCDTRTIINHIKNYINNMKTAISLHHGDEDPNCQFHGNHLHIMTNTEYKIHNTYIYKK